MSVYDQNKQKVNRIFISYSSIDRIRTNGLGLLLEAMGHQVFHDHRTIKPGSSWEAALQEGLEQADALMIFWTKHAAKSDWVRKEYEFFYATYPDRPLVPVLGDETALTEILKTRQHADFAPIVNEVLDMKRKMKKQGAGPGEINSAVMGRLEEAGIEIKTKSQRRQLWLFLGFGWLMTLLRQPAAWARQLGSGAVEKTAQVTVGQFAAIGAAAVLGLAAVPAKEAIFPQDQPISEDRIEAESGHLTLEGQLRVLTRDFSLSRTEVRQRLDTIYALLDRPFLTWVDSLNACRQEVAALKTEAGGPAGSDVSGGVPAAAAAGAGLIAGEPDYSRAPDAPPTEVDATAISDGVVRITWRDGSANEESFDVERCDGADCDDFETIARVPADMDVYDDTQVQAATYTYRVRATNRSGSSVYSNTDLADARVFSTGPVVTPKIRNRDRAQRITSEYYPDDLKTAGVKGNVVLNVWVDVDGKASLHRRCEPHVRRSSGNQRLDEAASQAVLQFEFEPAESAGRKVGTCVAVPITFY
ncbi:MAG: TonB family protein [Gemmatimonadota bacterium]|nr:MAG: TonB family protein [Gemmatimonadota bacterium]